MTPITLLTEFATMVIIDYVVASTGSCDGVL